MKIDLVTPLKRAFSLVELMISLITISVIVAAITKGVTLDTLTTCFFAVFGGEVFSCALIKIFNIKKGE